MHTQSLSGRGSVCVCVNSKDPLAIEHISVACAMRHNITYLQQMIMLSITFGKSLNLRLYKRNILTLGQAVARTVL